MYILYSSYVAYKPLKAFNCFVGQLRPLSHRSQVLSSCKRDLQTGIHVEYKLTVVSNA